MPFRILIAVAVVATMVGFFFLDHDWYAWSQTLADRLSEAGVLGSLLVIGLMIAAVVIAPIPTIPLTVTSGSVYGPFWGSVIAMTGALIGALLSFWIARYAGRDLVARLSGGHVALCPQCSDRLLFGVVLVARLIPVVSFGLVSYGAGLTAMTARAFALATTIGMVPMTILYVNLGSALHVSPVRAVAAGGLVLLLLLFLGPAVERFAPPRIRAMMSHLKSAGEKEET